MNEHARIEGGFLGLALGDALGAPFEGGVVERALWCVLGRTRDGRRRWTDDTAMSLDLAEELLDGNPLDQDALAARFARSYRWSRGYGPGTARLLRAVACGADWRVAVRAGHPEGSWGNGAAMRAPVVGLVHHARPALLERETRRSAEVTHAHPAAIEGALLVARATAAAVRGELVRDVLGTALADGPHRSRAELAAAWLRDRDEVSVELVARRLGNGMAAVESCVTALYVADRFLGAPFEDLLAFARKVRGDVDTISAMAGAIWGAANGVGALPAAALADLEDEGRLRAVAARLARSIG